MAETVANITLDAGDPRVDGNRGEGILSHPKREIKLLHDPNVKLEEYMFYAALSRRNEQRLHGANQGWNKIGWTPGYGQEADTDKSITILRRKRGGPPDATLRNEKENDEKIAARAEASLASHPSELSIAESKFLGVADSEWATASRATRTASWGAVFYLITTDILGPSSVPWALSQMGWGPGVVLYFVFGALAFYAGLQMWQMFLVLDSDRYPVKTYGDIAYRTMGKYARHAVNILQSVQLFFNVGILILSNGQSIYQISRGSTARKGLCFVVCNLIFTLAGFLLGQIRTLHRFGWIANLAIWLNILVLIITMAVCAVTAPNYESANSQNLIPLTTPPAGVYHYIGVNSKIGFSGQIVGLMQAIYSYGGAMLYCEFMSEMAKPWDFFKAQLCAELFIFFCYIFFGCFVYGYQGQYTILQANQGLSPYTWQTATNAIGLVSALIAACLYGNIGIKVVYQNVLREVLGAPALETPTGKLVWAGLVPVYWSLAFLICSAIPNIANFSALIAALCILQFSYTFPPLMMCALDVQRDAMLPEEAFDPVTGEVARVDAGWPRLARGFLVRRVPLKLWYLVFALGSLAVAALGVYSSVEGLISAFQKNPNVTTFGCAAPI